MANSSAQITARYDYDHQNIARIAIVLLRAESQFPIAPQANSKRFAMRLALFYSSLFGMMGTHLPFFSVWLKAVGIDAFWIGLITAVPPVTRVTVLPFVTALAERRQALRGALFVAGFATAAGLSFIRTPYPPVPGFLLHPLPR